jgi:hypothetical protein
MNAYVMYIASVSTIELLIRHTPRWTVRAMLYGWLSVMRGRFGVKKLRFGGSPTLCLMGGSTVSVGMHFRVLMTLRTPK